MGVAVIRVPDFVDVRPSEAQRLARRKRAAESHASPNASKSAWRHKWRRALAQLLRTELRFRDGRVLACCSAG